MAGKPRKMKGMRVGGVSPNKKKQINARSQVECQVCHGGDPEFQSKVNTRFEKNLREGNRSSVPPDQMHKDFSEQVLRTKVRLPKGATRKRKF